MDYGPSLIDGVPEAPEALIANPLSFGSAGHPQHEADLFRWQNPAGFGELTR
jgi:hypothetical protein